MKVLVLGGNRFFGKQLVKLLLDDGHNVTVLNRGNTKDSFGERITRIIADRKDPKAMNEVADQADWDVVYDQICFSPNQSKLISDAFKGKTKRYVFTSSMSVYPKQGKVDESDFDPTTHPLKMGKQEDFEYAEGKRQAEAYLFQKSSLPCVSVRLPFVMGLDDHTKRLHFHIDRIANGEAIYFPKIDAQVSFIHGDEAAKFLSWIGTKSEEKGIFNASSENPISLRKLVKDIETCTGKKAQIAEVLEDNHSPYGVSNDIYMEVRKAKKAGFNFSKIENWLPSLVKEIWKSA